MGEFYVYIHLRADSGLPFYIGKGKGGRAWEFRTRNEYWKRVHDRHGTIVEMLHTNLTEDTAYLIEAQEIAWARKYYEMTNISDGGEGGNLSERTDKKKEQIIQFFAANGRFPSELIDRERELAYALRNYTKPTTPAYDKDFRARMESLGYGRQRLGLARARKEATKAEILEFFREFGRFPSDRLPLERRLHHKLNSY